jgi:hypothetical protein
MNKADRVTNFATSITAEEILMVGEVELRLMNIKSMGNGNSPQVHLNLRGPANVKFSKKTTKEPTEGI